MLQLNQSTEEFEFDLSMSKSARYSLDSLRTYWLGR
jgi:hypothetical protein